MRVIDKLRSERDTLVALFRKGLDAEWFGLPVNCEREEWLRYKAWMARVEAAIAKEWKVKE